MSYFFGEAERIEHLEHVAYYEKQRPGLGARYLAAFDTRWCQSVSILIVFVLNLRREFGDVGSQDSRTASCTGNLDRTLKYLWSPLIVGAPTIGWAGFDRVGNGF